MMTGFATYEIGAGALGFVFGWIIYFAIRGRSGEISGTEITAVFGAVAGGAVTGFFGSAKDPAITADAIGAYGIGVFLGFAAYFITIIMREAGRNTAATSGSVFDSALETMTQSGIDRGLRSGLLRMKNLRVGDFSVLSQPSPSQDARQCIDAIDGLLIEISEKIISVTGDRLNALVEAERKLSSLKVACFATIGLEALSSPEIRELSRALTTETQNLQAEAAKLSDLTEQASKVTNLLNLLGKLRNSVSRFL